jgi:hypothetical protein
MYKVINTIYQFCNFEKNLIKNYLDYLGIYILHFYIIHFKYEHYLK